MTNVTPATPSPEELAEWFKLVKQLADIKQREHFLRLKLFKGYFPDPKEGTNTYVLPDKYQIKGISVINRKVVEEALQAMSSRPQIGVNEQQQPIWGHSKLEEAGVIVGDLIKWEPSLITSAYRALTAEQMKVVDQILLISPGSPSMKIEPPAKPRGSAKKDKPAVDGVAEDNGAPEA